MPIREVQELFAGELCAIVGDDDVGYPEPVDYVGEEEDRLLGADVCDGSSLDPLGELVDGHQQMGVPSCCLLEWAHEVKALHHKRPSDGDHLQCVSGEVGLVGIELAPVACVHIWERNKELIRKRTDIDENFTREVIQSIVFIFLPLGERVHLTNPVYYY